MKAGELADADLKRIADMGPAARLIEEKLYELQEENPESAYQRKADLGHMEGNGGNSQTRSIPILLYHNIAQAADGSMTISRETFERHMKAIKDAGYTAISFTELIAYAEIGTTLPRNPVIITFDDGYLSNYDIAFPILKKYQMKATIFPIGITVGQSFYKDTGVAISPHFDLAEMREMADSGLISFQSHTYDMHQVDGLDDPAAFRLGVLQRSDESSDMYKIAFYADFRQSKSQLEATTGQPVVALSYPYGVYSTESEEWLADMGVKVTLTTGHQGNVVEKGGADSVRLLSRFTITEEYSASDVIKLLGGKGQTNHRMVDSGREMGILSREIA